jgi:thiamine pyrophosphate-dependent acetolactate synthase large subunit-like protein
MVSVALQGTPYDETTMPPVELRKPTPLATPPSVDALASATDLLAEARSVLLLAGAGAVRAGALPALHALADDLGALLCTTVRAHGAFNNSPWSLGSAGAFGHPLLPELAATADVVIAAGASLNGWTTGHGALIGPQQRIIRIDVDADRIDQAPAATVGIVADAKLTAEALRTEVRARGLPPTGVRTEALRERLATEAWSSRVPSVEPDGAHIDPRALTVALNDLLAMPWTLVVDAGHFLGFAMRYFTVSDVDGLIFALDSEACGLGLPTAIGAALADDGRPTVLAVGDGGLLMAASELETLARLRLPVLVLVYDDASHAGERHMFTVMGQPVDVTRFPPTDFVAIAGGYGINGTTVRAEADLGPVKEWLAQPDGPFLIDAKIDPTVLCDWIWSMLPTA